jgi:crotonobetainyl-CoA:carnitine CoA-transferase CaiB-like acyl-CoA transferase
MRSWGPFPGGIPDPNRSGLFEYLNAGKRGTTVDLERDVSEARRLITDAHVLVDALPPGTLVRSGLDISALEALSPGRVVVRISDFGHYGPLRDRVAAPLTMQAASGWINKRDPDRPPVQAGARISECVAGAYAALGALTASRTRSARMRRAVEVEVSVLESLLSTLSYPMLIAEKMRSLGLPANTRSAPMMGMVRAADGWVGINCPTGQHWLDVCAMLGCPNTASSRSRSCRGPERAEFYEKAQPWLSARDGHRIETGDAHCGFPVNDGATVADCPQYRERGFVVDAGGDGWSFR